MAKQAEQRAGPPPGTLDMLTITGSTFKGPPRMWPAVEEN